MNCPDCTRPLSDVATACRCGWIKGQAETKPHIQCAHDSCGTSAVLKRKTPTGWANFCDYHNMQYQQTQALATYRKLGLERYADETCQEHKARVFEYIKLMARTSVMNRHMEAA